MDSVCWTSSVHFISLNMHSLTIWNKSCAWDFNYSELLNRLTFYRWQIFRRNITCENEFYKRCACICWNVRFSTCHPSMFAFILKTELSLEIKIFENIFISTFIVEILLWTYKYPVNDYGKFRFMCKKFTFHCYIFEIILERKQVLLKNAFNVWSID